MKFFRSTGSTVVAITVVLASTIPGCSPSMDSECRSSAECPANEFCRLGECTDLDDPTAGGVLTLDDAGTGPGKKTDVDAADVPNSTDTDDAAEPHPCPDAPAASAEEVVLNEFLANVPAGEAGDANDDGVRHYHDDEFVELVNTADTTVDMTNVAIFDGDDERFRFDEFCLAPLNAVVVFGGIEIGATPPEGEGFESFVSDSWFRFAQNGGHVVVRDAQGDPIADVEYGTHPEGSLNLHEDLDGGSYGSHPEISDDDKLFSPGTCSDGRPFTSGCGEDDSDWKTAPD